jgi:hypothetical protein
MACFIAMAMLCSLELCVLVYSKFRRRTGLYFWSIVVAIFATTLYQWSDMVQYFLIPGEHLWLLSILGSTGYVLYVLSDFLMLYSRLHLVQASPRTLRIVRSVMIAEFLLVTIPDTILANGALYLDGWAFPGSIFRRVEIVIYCTVEISLSIVYILHVRRMWSTESSPMVQRVCKDLLYMNILIIILELSNVGIEYSANYALQNCYTVHITIHATPIHFSLIRLRQTFLFAYKLKIEIWMLNKLTELAQSTLRATEREFDMLSPASDMSVTSAQDGTKQISHKHS